MPQYECVCNTSLIYLTTTTRYAIEEIYIYVNLFMTKQVQ